MIGPATAAIAASAVVLSISVRSPLLFRGLAAAGWLLLALNPAPLAAHPSHGLSASASEASSTGAASAATATPTPITQSYSRLIAALSKPADLEYRDVTAELSANLAPALLFPRQQFSHAEIVDYYRRNLSAFAALFPEFSLRQNFDVLQGYGGSLPLTSFEVFFLPFAPIVPEASYDLTRIRFLRFSVKDEQSGKTIPGLKMQSSLSPVEHSAAVFTSIGYRLHMVYIASLNARVMGFSHGRVIGELSQVAPSDDFEYNGARPWSQHSRYAKDDQMKRPIKLTNVAHQSGGRYDISSHPDFALTGRLAADQPISATFFFWKSRGKLLWLEVPIGENELPDFVFQLELFRPGQGPFGG